MTEYEGIKIELSNRVYSFIKDLRVAFIFGKERHPFIRSPHQNFDVLLSEVRYLLSQETSC